MLISIYHVWLIQAFSPEDRVTFTISLQCSNIKCTIGSCMHDLSDFSTFDVRKSNKLNLITNMNN